MQVNIKQLNLDQDYSEALKEALVMRSKGAIPREMDDALGLIIFNISRWAVAETDRLVAMHEDVICDVNLKVLQALPKVDLNQPAKRILGFLRKTAKNAHYNMIRDSKRIKRSAELLQIDEIQIATDFHGNRIQ